MVCILCQFLSSFQAQNVSCVAVYGQESESFQTGQNYLNWVAKMNLCPRLVELFEGGHLLQNLEFKGIVHPRNWSFLCPHLI